VTALLHDRAARRQGFGQQTLAERYPRILQRTLNENSDADVVEAIASLAGFVAGETPLGVPAGIDDSTWQALYQANEGARAPEIDFLDLEYLVFHQILLAHRYFERFDDPFALDKRLDLDKTLPAYAATFDRLTDLGSAFKVSLLGNAHDASQLDIKSNGRVLDLDMPPNAIERDVVDIICDNAGHEFLSDLVLAAHILRTTTSKVRLHVKAMPWFVSDVTFRDALTVFDALGSAPVHHSAFGSALLEGREDHRLDLIDRPHWTRPISFGEGHLTDALGTSDSFVIVKGDLNYRRCIADVSTDIFTPWQSLPYRPDVPVLSLRSVKSHCWAGVPRKSWPADLDAVTFPMDGTYFCIQSIEA
jgi:hypothetical protein